MRSFIAQGAGCGLGARRCDAAGRALQTRRSPRWHAASATCRRALRMHPSPSICGPPSRRCLVRADGAEGRGLPRCAVAAPRLKQTSAPARAQPMRSAGPAPSGRRPIHEACRVDLELSELKLRKVAEESKRIKQLAGQDEGR